MQVSSPPHFTSTSVADEDAVRCPEPLQMRLAQHRAIDEPGEAAGWLTISPNRQSSASTRRASRPAGRGRNRATAHARQRQPRLMRRIAAHDRMRPVKSRFSKATLTPAGIVRSPRDDDLVGRRVKVGVADGRRAPPPGRRSGCWPWRRSKPSGLGPAGSATTLQAGLEEAVGRADVDQRAARMRADVEDRRDRAGPACARPVSS